MRATIQWTEEKKEQAIQRLTKYFELYGSGEMIAQNDEANIEAIVRSYVNNSFDSIQVREGSTYLNLKDVEKNYSSLDDILNAINLLEQEKQELEAKRAFMFEVGTVSFDEDEFRAYQCLKTLENSDLSTYEKAKKIMKLLK